MSPTDIIQLFMLNQQYPNLFAVVLSPREEGLKALCVRLTKAGRNKVRDYFLMEGDSPLDRAIEHVRQRISDSAEEFYCQIPFILSEEESCQVVDLRDEHEVIGQLRHFIISGNADDCWVSM